MIQTWRSFLQQQKSLNNNQSNSAEHEAGNLITDLSQMTYIEVAGPDALTFLQGQLSCDFNSIDETSASLGAYCNIQGRIECLFLAFKIDNSFYLRFPIGLREATVSELKKYAMFSKVELDADEASLKMVGIGLSGEKIPAHLAEIFDNIPEEPYLATSKDGMSLIRVPGNSPRFELAGSPEKIMGHLKKWEDSLPLLDQHYWEELEIEANLPEIYTETSAKFLPHHINLPDLNAINFKKGCYRGQEIIARMHYRGNIKRHLYYLHGQLQGTIPTAGDPVFAVNDQAKEIGKLVRITTVAGDKITALAEISDSAAESGELGFVIDNKFMPLEHKRTK